MDETEFGEKRFLRREIINYYLLQADKYPTFLCGLRISVRDDELYRYGKELNIYSSKG